MLLIRFKWAIVYLAFFDGIRGKMRENVELGGFITFIGFIRSLERAFTVKSFVI